jgi:hypothetical protein
MNIHHIKSEEEYNDVMAYLKKCSNNPPQIDSEEADIINHLGTIAAEWAESNLKITEQVMIQEEHMLNIYQIKKNVDLQPTFIQKLWLFIRP